MIRQGDGKALGHKERGRDLSLLHFNCMYFSRKWKGWAEVYASYQLLEKSEIAAAFAPLDVSIVACAGVPPYRSQGRRCVFIEEPQPSEHCWSDLQVRHLAASILLRQSQSSSLATESLIINPPNSLRPPPIKPLLQRQLSTLHQRSVEGEWKKGWCRKVIKNFFQTPSASPCPQISVPAVYLKYRLPQTMSAIKAHQQTAILQLWSFWALGQRHLLPHPTEHREFILTATQNSAWQREQLLVQPKWLGYKQFRLI